MNKARRSVSLLARSFSELGIGTLIVDLYGTGDSQGEFADARWDIWREDINCAAKWLKQQGTDSLGLVGLRMGTLLAMDCVDKLNSMVEDIVLWQPMINGKAMMTQFLRLRTTASSMGQSTKKESVHDLRERLRQGQTLEVAGYELAPELVSAIDNLNLSPPAQNATYSIHCFELVYGSEVSPANKQFVNLWQEQGAYVSIQPICAPPFWEGQNITVVPELLHRTARIFQEEVVT